MKNSRTDPKRPAVATLIAAFSLTLPVLGEDLHVPEDHPTIQEAVDAAFSGDTIHIAPGIYMEQTKILSKDLTLIGRPGTILRAFPNMESADGDNVSGRALLYINQTSDVHLRSLTFQGDQMADQNEWQLIGAYFLDAGGSIENCRFVGFREKIPASSQTSASAINVWSDLPSSPSVTATIANNTIIDSYEGISLVGAPDKTNVQVSIMDNTIVGTGPSVANSNLEGIRILDGVAGEVERNSISHFSYVGDNPDRDSPLAFGIIGLSRGFPTDLVPLAPLRFADNTLRDNQVHFALGLADESVVTNNTFEGKAQGVRPVGLWLTGKNIQVTGNEFRELEEGIRLGGEDPDFGTVLGFAINAQLTDNRFCEVTTPTTKQPGATGTESGSLTCPFPEPDLVIKKVVLLSWADDSEEYELDSSSSPEGPWTPSSATTFLQDGKVNAAVPTDADNQYFRLRKR